jgi:hypothetical protein
MTKALWIISTPPPNTATMICTGRWQTHYGRLFSWCQLQQRLAFFSPERSHELVKAL